MDLGFTSKMGEYYLQALAGKSAATKSTVTERTTAGKNGGVSFKNIVLEKSAQEVSEQENVNLANFKNRLQAMFPGAYYHVMDASKIPQGTWQRMDFPFEKFLAEEDENGEVARWNLISGGGGITGPTEEEQRQFEEEQKAKKLRRAKYARINEEYALKRKLQEMERNKAYYQESVKALPLSSIYQRRIREAMNSVSHSLVSASTAGVMTNSITGACK